MAAQTYPETDQTTSSDVMKATSIDYINTFTKGTKRLMEMLGLFQPIVVANGTTIKTYKYTDKLTDGAVAEGELIPLSKTTKALDQTITLTLKKWRKSATAEAIQEKGRAGAVNETDARLLAGIQDKLKADLFAAITSTEKTSDEGATLQAAIANMWGKLYTLFEDYDGVTDPDAEGGDQFVFFVNPLDVAAQMGDASISMQTAFGFKYVKDFLGMGTAIVSAVIPKGTVFGTAAKNMQFAYVPANGGELASTFGLTSDETGAIGMTHSVNTANASIETLVMGAWAIFAETKDGVLKGTIKEPASMTARSKPKAA